VKNLEGTQVTAAPARDRRRIHTDDLVKENSGADVRVSGERVNL
jgi:hypothetical protein